MLRLPTGGSKSMRTNEQINGFLDLARESSAQGERLRRRVAAIGALSLLVCGLLLAMGFGILVLAFLAGTVVSAGLIAIAAVWPQLRPRARDWSGRVRLR